MESVAGSLWEEKYGKEGTEGAVGGRDNWDLCCSFQPFAVTHLQTHTAGLSHPISC